jgi:hypothetical protein
MGCVSEVCGGHDGHPCCDTVQRGASETPGERSSFFKAASRRIFVQMPTRSGMATGGSYHSHQTCSKSRPWIWLQSSRSLLSCHIGNIVTLSCQIPQVAVEVPPITLQFVLSLQIS